MAIPSCTLPGCQREPRGGRHQAWMPRGLPSTLGGRVLALTDFCPHRGGPALGKGQGEAEKGGGSAPAHPPRPWAAAGGARSPGWARRCPGSAAGMQSVTVVPLITEHRCREGSGTKGPLCPANGAVHSWPAPCEEPGAALPGQQPIRGDSPDLCCIPVGLFCQAENWRLPSWKLNTCWSRTMMEQPCSGHQVCRGQSPWPVPMAGSLPSIGAVPVGFCSAKRQ